MKSNKNNEHLVNAGKRKEGTVMPENMGRAGANGPIPGGEAYRFKPGQSGNPGGRPKAGALARACRVVLERPVPGDRKGLTYAEAIAERLGEFAIKGHIMAIREFADRAEGKAGQALEIETRRAEAEDVPPCGLALESQANATPKLQEEALASPEDFPS
jgi:hypothetical protein